MSRCSCRCGHLGRSGYPSPRKTVHYRCLRSASGRCRKEVDFRRLRTGARQQALEGLDMTPDRKPRARRATSLVFKIRSLSRDGGISVARREHGRPIDCSKRQGAASNPVASDWGGASGDFIFRKRCWEDAVSMGETS